MATYGREHNPVILDDIALIKDQIRRDIFDQSEDPTYVVTKSVSGTIDPFTEEVTNYLDPTYHPVSGIISQVMEGDLLLGINGRVQIGDVLCTYHYDTISGIFLNNLLKQIQILTPPLSGMYHVQAVSVESFANQPIYVKVALKLDDNG